MYKDCAEEARNILHLLYLYQFGDYSAKSGTTCVPWERDLGLDLSDNDWEAIHTLIHKSSLNVTVQENGYPSPIPSKRVASGNYVHCGDRRPHSYIAV